MYSFNKNWTRLPVPGNRNIAVNNDKDNGACSQGVYICVRKIGFNKIISYLNAYKFG
jgi:hypothetical protein